MTSRRATTDNDLAAFMTTKFQIDAMPERLNSLSDDHFETHADEINWGHVGTVNHVARAAIPLFWFPDKTDVLAGNMCPVHFGLIQRKCP
jgi:hypothetical protein